MIERRGARRAAGAAVGRRPAAGPTRVAGCGDRASPGCYIPPVRRFGVFTFDPQTGDLWRDGHATRLQEQARMVLRVLTDRPGELVTRDEIRHMLWADDTFVDFDTGLNVVITKIRQALDDSAAAPRFVETLPRRGYRFVAPIVPAPVAGPVAAPAPPGRRPWRWLAGIGAVAAVAAVAVALLWSRGGFGRPAGVPQIRAVAVLPLENLSGDETADLSGGRARRGLDHRPCVDPIAARRLAADHEALPRHHEIDRRHRA